LFPPNRGVHFYLFTISSRQIDESFSIADNDRSSRRWRMEAMMWPMLHAAMTMTSESA
jgi:hypothetical protein